MKENNNELVKYQNLVTMMSENINKIFAKHDPEDSKSLYDEINAYLESFKEPNLNYYQSLKEDIEDEIKNCKRYVKTRFVNRISDENKLIYKQIEDTNQNNPAALDKVVANSYNHFKNTLDKSTLDKSKFGGDSSFTDYEDRLINEIMYLLRLRNKDNATFNDKHLIIRKKLFEIVGRHEEMNLSLVLKEINDTILDPLYNVQDRLLLIIQLNKSKNAEPVVEQESELAARLK